VLRELAELTRALGEAHYKTGRLAEADEMFRKALGNHKRLHLDHGQPQRNMAVAQMDLGDFLVMGKDDLTQAWEAYRPILAYFEDRYKKAPDLVDTRHDLAAIEYRLGGLLRRAKEKHVALPGIDPQDTPLAHFQRSCKLREALAEIDPDDMQAKLEWALALARSGRGEEAVAQGELLAKKGQGDPRLLFQTVCVFALASETDEEKKAERRERTFKLLDELLHSGWKDYVSLRDDPDLDPLRGDPRFEEIVARAEETTHDKRKEEGTTKDTKNTKGRTEG
jgi:tetratricopeptide (TPR) repeat protein